MYEIAERCAFTATHQFAGHPLCHGRPLVHLHRWTVEVVLVAGQLPPVDHPSELEGLDQVRRYVARALDCRHLNDILTGAPAPENVALHLADWCRHNLTGFARSTVSSVAVSIGTGSLARVLTAGTRTSE